jgi:hypothetical protein
VPVSWTNYAPDDPFIRLSEGKALFRAEELLELYNMIHALNERQGEEK